MKIHALVLGALLWAFGSGAVSVAQGAAVGAQGSARAVDETALAIADPAATPGNAVAAEAAPNTLVYFLRMLVVLALVLGAMYLVFLVLRALSRPKSAEDSAIRVLASTGLGSGKSLHVVAVGERAWLVGASDASVSLLAPIEDKELVDGLLLKAATAATAPKPDFATLLAGLAGGKGGSRKGGAGVLGSGDYLSRQRERLRRFKGPDR